MTATVTVSGGGYVGVNLTATAGNLGAESVVSYLWNTYTTSTGSGEVAISTATSPSFAPRVADIGKWVSCTITFSGASTSQIGNYVPITYAGASSTKKKQVAQKSAPPPQRQRIYRRITADAGVEQADFKRLVRHR
jgi:hypothetical protein